VKPILIRRPALKWSLYVLRCGDGSLYTGVAIDVARRFEAHCTGKGARYTRGRGPLSIVAKAACGERGDALSIERSFKKLSRPEKDDILTAGLSRFVRRARRLRSARAAR
jgi:predicted GIY-YIG superfamily endonuclease